MERDLEDELLALLESHRQQEEGLDEDQRRRLETLLVEHPELRTVFARDQMLETALHLESAGGLAGLVAGEGAQALAVVDAPPPQKARSSARQPVGAWIGWAAAAAVMLLVGLAIGELWRGDRSGDGGLVTTPGSEAEGTVSEVPIDNGVALLSQAVDAVWADEEAPGLGAILSPGPLRLESGSVRIEFYSGARVVVEGPAELDLVSVNEAICRQGRLRAFVPPHARGFRVVSPRFELIDLGTEFGMEVGEDGLAEIQVFDGEVELHPLEGARNDPAGVKKVLGGEGVAWTPDGIVLAASTSPERFPSFAKLERQTSDVRSQRRTRWQAWNEEVSSDPRLVFHYDFERLGERLLDRGPQALHGTIVGCERTSGRWQDKGALEFKRPSDRVRIEVPGSFDQLTLNAWIRMDATTGRMQSLLLTDRYEVGRPHWQISAEGALRLGLRARESQDEPQWATGYGTDPLMRGRRIGTWQMVSVVYDRPAGTVTHYLNGREMAHEALIADLPLRIGAAEIGNWLAMDEVRKRAHEVRNFVGRIDSVTAWRGALPAGDVKAVYDHTRP